MNKELSTYKIEVREGVLRVKENLEVAETNSLLISAHEIINFRHFDEEGQILVMADLIRLFKNQLEILHEAHNKLKYVETEITGTFSKRVERSVLQRFDKIHVEMNEIERKMQLCIDKKTSPKIVRPQIDWFGVERQLNGIANALYRWFQKTVPTETLW